MEDLKDKVVIITGAARGMGRTHALAFAGKGAKVVASDVLDCTDLVKEIGNDAIAVKCDISSKEEVDNLINKTIETFGRVDILVNNAGIVDFKDFLSISESDWDRMLDINLKGYFLCSQAAAKEMVKNNSGVIINVGSIAMGQVGIAFPCIAHYVASKGGVAGLTAATALELGKYNIRVNAVAPGMIETNIAEGSETDSKASEMIKAKLPMKRIGQPEEVSSVVLFLASDAASYMTGAIVTVDGGWLVS